MKQYKPKKWFTYTRLILVFGVIFLLGRTSNIMYNVITVEDSNEKKTLSENTITENKEEIYTTENPVLTKYISLPEKGFILSVDNKKYELTGLDYDMFVAIVASESRANKDDVLAVMSVILNRSDSSGKTPLQVVTAPGQFTGYLDGHYLKFLYSDGTLNTQSVGVVKEVVDDALNGVRNNNYYSFRSGWVTSFSDNQIAYKGNRFK